MQSYALRGVTVIAARTLLEALRNRLLLVALAFSVALVLLSVAAATVAIGNQSRLVVDVGLAAASGMGSLIALANTIHSFAQELRNRTAYPLLVRPVPRWSFVLGKFFGNLIAMMAVVTVMLLTTALIVWLFGDPVPTALWGSIWLSYVEMALVVGVAILFSTMTSPVLAATYTVGVLLMGNLAAEITGIADSLITQGKGLGIALRGAYYVVPDLQDLSLRAQAANGLPVPAGYLLHGTLYGVAYASLALVVAMWIFSRREVL